MQDTTDVPYATITMSLNKDGIHDEDQFEEAILDYAIEWKQLVTLKFTSGIKQVKDSHRIMDHYERKVDTLRERVLTRVIGNEAPSRLAEKLERNEEKLRQANRTFEKHERNFGLRVDVAIDESWKDLYQLIVRLFTFDAKSSQQQAMVLSDLDNILNGLSLVGREHGLPFEGGGTANLWRNLRSQCQEKSSTNKKKPIKADKSSDSSGSEAATSWTEDSFEQLWSGGEMAAI